MTAHYNWRGISKWLVISAIVIALDFYTKQLIVQHFSYGEHMPVTTFFDLVRYHNEGAAFSFLAAAGGWQKYFFSAIAIVAAVIIVRLLMQNLSQKLFCFGLALVLGGALGNLIDRISLGHVIDFLYFHYLQYDFPAFNVADSAITCGVGVLLLDSFKKV
ncbi:MAG TPA: signal peptidase II [Methylophilaceae bacterium]|jgi:signal peptidase II